MELFPLWGQEEGCCCEISCTHFCVDVSSSLLGVYLGVELLGHMLTLWETASRFPKRLYGITFPPVLPAFFWHIQVLNHIYSLFYGFRFWVLERSLYPKILEEFCVSMIYITIFGQCGWSVCMWHKGGALYVVVVSGSPLVTKYCHKNWNWKFAEFSIENSIFFLSTLRFPLYEHWVCFVTSPSLCVSSHGPYTLSCSGFVRCFSIW